MKILIAITSCARDREKQQAQRDTWIKDIPAGVDYRFFLGNPAAADAKDDEVFLDVPDTYVGLTHKTKGLLEWALALGYDYIYKTDVDTLVHVKNLLSSGYEGYDYMGGLNGIDGVVFASGGAGYWLSAKAAAWVTALQVQDGCEDVLVAQIMTANGVKLHDDPRYEWLPGAPLTSNTVSFHLSSTVARVFKAEMMYNYYRKMMSMGVTPIITVACPTGDRPNLIPMAIRCFLDQDFYESEMVILDDGVTPTVVPPNHRIRYVRVEGQKLTTGAKRNMCAELAQGEYICHFDDDDWSAPNRLTFQMRRLMNKQVTGFCSLSFYNVTSKVAHRWHGVHAGGAGQAYHKKFWKDHKFPDLRETEDVHFLQAAEAAKQQDMCNGHELIVCRRHGENTWAYDELKSPIPMMKENESFFGLRRVPVDSLPPGFITAMGIVITAPNITHTKQGYCFKHKQLGCPSCTAGTDSMRVHARQGYCRRHKRLGCTTCADITEY